MTSARKKSLIARSAPILLTIYCVAVLVFFLAELKLFGLDDYLRATNQVLVLFALLILPFVVINMPGFVQSLTLRVSDKEFHVQLTDLQESISGDIGKVERQVSTAEQSLWPLLAGQDSQSSMRLSGDTKQLVLGSKYDASQLFFTELLAQTIRTFVPNTEVEIRYPNGGSLRNFADVKFRWVDVYIDYTGTCCQYFNIAHKTALGDAKTDQAIIDELNVYGSRIGMKWLSPLGCSEDYCLVMAPEVADNLQIHSLQDLKQHASKLVFTGDPEFINRKDCYLGLQEYGISFAEVIPCHITQRYAALETGQASVFVGYESDPNVVNQRVRKLTDPDQFFPRYMALPLVSDAALAQVEGLEEALHKLAGIMTTDDLNAVVVGLAQANFHPIFARSEAARFLAKLG